MQSLRVEHHGSPRAHLTSHVCAVVLGIILTLYGVLAVFPFYWLGIHHQSVDAIRRGQFDPKRYAPFAYEGVGNLLHAFTLLVVWWAPLLIGSLLLTLLVTTYQRRASSTWATRLLHGCLLLAGVVALAFMLSPTGWIIGVWHFD